MKRLSILLMIGLAASAVAAEHEESLKRAFGPLFNSTPPAAKSKSGSNKGLDTLHRWNQIAIDASGFDHANAREQLGPGRASRALAIVHIAMFDAVNAAMGGYESHTGVRARKGPLSIDAAISRAARDTLVELFPSQAASFTSYLAQDLAAIKDKKAKTNGVLLGRAVAAAVLAARSGDGSEIPEPQVGTDHPTSDLPGRWRQDPISLIPLALGGHWAECIPFVVDDTSQFRCPPPPALNSPEYTAAFNEAKRLGGDGVITPTDRTPEQTFIGLFWAYDGTPSLCAPPRLYNQIAVQIADQARLSTIHLARLLALVNVSMADAGMCSWESKYHWDYWRPITGIREADPGTGPTGAGDGNPDTLGDPLFSPLGAPASNLSGPNFTPPFPAYPSGHATFGGALFQTLRRFFGTDDIEFTFISDEFNGVTKDNQGQPRPLIPRTFTSLSQAEEENGQSRIYLGIHWSFDKTEGIAQGRKIADYVYDNAFRPKRRK
jgi:PAP2 superfamily